MRPGLAPGFAFRFRAATLAVEPELENIAFQKEVRFLVLEGGPVRERQQVHFAVVDAVLRIRQRRFPRGMQGVGVGGGVVQFEPARPVYGSRRSFVGTGTGGHDEPRGPVLAPGRQYVPLLDRIQWSALKDRGVGYLVENEVLPERLELFRVGRHREESAGRVGPGV